MRKNDNKNEQKTAIKTVKKMIVLTALTGAITVPVFAEENAFTSSDAELSLGEWQVDIPGDAEDSLFTSDEAEETPETADSEKPEENADTEEETENKKEEKKENLGQQIVDFAMQYVGNPYVWGGTSLESGADCSGFVLSVFAEFGVELPHFAASQAGFGTEVSVDELEPGDLVFYGYGDISHVAIYKGNQEIVHAQNEEAGICVTQVDIEPIVCCRRLV